MNKKMTRRAVLGTAVAALAAGPFVIRALRRNRILHLSSPVDLLYREYAERLSIPREFDPDAKFGGIDCHLHDDPSIAPPKEVRAGAVAVQKRFWQNYSKLDELKFVLSSAYYVDGELKPDSHYFGGADVWVKLGYGVEVKGKNRLGKQVHLVYTLDEVSDQPDDEHRVNLSGFVFGLLGDAYPAFAKYYTGIEENVPLPNSWQRTYTEPPYPPGLPDRFDVQPHGLYTRLTGGAENLLGPNNIFRNRYFSQETGMPELAIVESVLECHEHCSPLYEIDTYQNVNGVYFPLKCSGGKIDGWRNAKPTGNEKVYAWEKEYSDVKIKLIS